MIVTTEDGPKENLELRSALKEVKIKLAETRLIKKSILEFKRQRQAEYTSYTRQRGSMIRSGGGIGKFIRAMSAISRDSKRAALDSDLIPFEHGQAVADAAIRALQAIEIQIKARI